MASRLEWGVEDAIKSMKVIDAVFESEKTGAWANGLTQAPAALVLLPRDAGRGPATGGGGGHNQRPHLPLAGRSAQLGARRA